MKLVTLKRKRFIVSVSLLKKSDGELRGPAFFLLARLSSLRNHGQETEHLFRRALEP